MSSLIRSSNAELEFTALFPFCGLGAGARGFLDASVRLLGHNVRFRSLGGIDFEQRSCEDFALLTDSPALQADIHDLTAEQLKLFCPEAPDVIFASPPCKGFSSLMNQETAKDERYQRMNRLVLRWLELVLETWPARLPKLILIENVPQIASRGAFLVRKVKELLKKAGYVFHSGFHECGEIGGLAQVRRRFLLVARLSKQLPPLLYQPPKKRVKVVGEVLGKLPMPHDPAAGPMHLMPRISWLNWMRLAMIPAGGDWRDIPGVLEEGQERRAVFRRHHVTGWDQTSPTVAGPGSNGPQAVCDPRLKRELVEYKIEMVGDAQLQAAACDPRISKAFDHGYAVLNWKAESSPTVAGGSHPGQGAYSVGDPRIDASADVPSHGLLRFSEVEKMMTPAGIDEGKWVAVDSRSGARHFIEKSRRPPSFVPVIVAKDETWHRPLTTLELAALQGLPSTLNGKPLVLAGSNVSAWRERIGNAVPVQAAQAIAEQMLVTLTHGAFSSFALSGSNEVWVRGEDSELECSYVPMH